jgi:hypothetical protein
MSFARHKGAAPTRVPSCASLSTRLFSTTQEQALFELTPFLCWIVHSQASSPFLTSSSPAATTRMSAQSPPQSQPSVSTPPTPWIRNGIPIVTASTRSQIHETTPWFRQLRGGISSKGDDLDGVLFGSSSQVAEFLNDNTVITRLADHDQTDTKATAMPSRLRAAENALRTKR